MILKIWLVLIILSEFVQAKELFTKEKIAQYLTDKNPYIYTARAKEYAYKAKVEYYEGAFDTQLVAKYDNKEYPASTGKFLDVSLQKPTQSGLELVAGYRKAQGTQEYNNIKTSEDGEALIGVKIPVFEMLNKTNSRKLNLETAKLQSTKYLFASQNNLRLLYMRILKSYYTLLYYKTLLRFEKELLHRTKKREIFVQKRVTSGSLPELSLVEVRQQMISRKQRVIFAKNNYSKSVEIFLQYINVSKETFFDQYDFKDVLENRFIDVDLDNAVSEALQNRADLKVLKYEYEQQQLQKQNTQLLAYPRLNLSLYGVHDFKYNQGFKVALEMKFPVQRREYHGKNNEIDRNLENIQKLKEKKLLNIKTSLTNIVASLGVEEQNLELSTEELKLAVKLENAENKRYQLGDSNLFMLNQREMYTLEVKKKIVKYKLDYLLLKEEFYNETAKNRIFNKI